MSPRNNHEVPVKESTTRFSFLVLFHIQPKRLKITRKVWKITKNMSSMCQIIVWYALCKGRKNREIIKGRTTQDSRRRGKQRKGVMAQRHKGGLRLRLSMRLRLRNEE